MSNTKSKNNKFILLSIIILCVLLFLLYYFSPQIGFLTPIDTQWQEVDNRTTRIDTNEEAYPLRYISDGYRFVKIDETLRGIPPDQFQFEDIGIWRWRYKILNLSSRNLNVTINFILKDKDGFVLTEDSNTVKINAEETEMITGESEIDIDDIRRVDHRSWSINYFETGFSTDKIEIEDKNFESIIRESIYKPSSDINLNDLKNIEHLSIKSPDNEIESIDEIVFMDKLKKLNINFKINDLTILEELDNLKELYITENSIIELSSLKNMRNLKVLNLGMYDKPYNNYKTTTIDDFERALGLHEILKESRTNRLSNNIKDLSPLRNLENLVRLDFSNNIVSDLSPVSSLENLEVITFRDNNISDITPLKHLDNLWVVGMDNNKISDISVLENMPNLRWVYLENNKVDDVSPLVNNKNLDSNSYIDIRNNHLDIEEGSEDMINIQSLLDRGIGVEYDPQNN